MLFIELNPRLHLISGLLIILYEYFYLSIEVGIEPVFCRLRYFLLASATDALVGLLYIEVGQFLFINQGEHMNNKQPLQNCEYNEVKLLHQLSCLLWFVQKHAIKDAQDAGHQGCATSMKDLETDLEKHITKLKEKIGKACK